MAQVIFKTSEKFKHVQALRAGQVIADHSYETLDQSDLIQLSLAYAQRESNRYRFTPVSKRGNAEKIKATIEALKNFNVSEETFEKELDQWHDLILSIEGIDLDGSWRGDTLSIDISHKGLYIGRVNFCPNSYIQAYSLDIHNNFWRRLYLSELFKVIPWTEDQLLSAVKADNWSNSIWDYVETH
jgi:hypothetical protein